MSLPPVRNPQKLINPLRQRVLSLPLPLEVVCLCSPTSFPAATYLTRNDLGPHRDRDWALDALVVVLGTCTCGPLDAGQDWDCPRHGYPEVRALWVERFINERPDVIAALANADR